MVGSTGQTDPLQFVGPSRKDGILRLMPRDSHVEQEEIWMFPLAG